MKETTVRKAPFSPSLNNMAFLALILIIGPLAWSVDLFLKFILASNACLNPNPSHRWLSEPSAFIVIDLIAIAVTAIAMWQAYRSWRETIPGDTDHFRAVTEVGEGRQHFLALWGMLIGALFISAIVFSFVVNVAVQPCTS
jgi:hypothetical protein